MRRLCAAGAAIVVCLALGGMPAVAQSPSVMPSAAPTAPAGPALVSGGESCYATACIDSLSDPRVSGVATYTIQYRCPISTPTDGTPNLPGCTSWGTHTIKGPDGTWTGTWAGLWDPSLNRASLLMILNGTGAYDGWVFVARYLHDMQTEASVSGVIYYGRPPTMQ
jgi:hypothetical protein